MAEVTEKMFTPRILIVGDDEPHGTFLEQTLPAEHRAATYWTPPPRALKALQQAPYHLILLDMFTPQARCLNLMAEFRSVHPTSKIILFAHAADKPAGIKALQMGAYDLLEKPLSPDLLGYAMTRALEAQQTELHYQEALAELTQTQQELRDSKTHLAALNQALLDTHKALSILAHNTEKGWQETEEHIMSQIKLLLSPIIENMNRDGELNDQGIQFNDLMQEIERVRTSHTTISAASSLSSREWSVAYLIKQGMSNEEISDHLHISPMTVKTHRRNIRKKLGIAGTKNKLFTYFHMLEHRYNPYKILDWHLNKEEIPSP